MPNDDFSFTQAEVPPSIDMVHAVEELGSQVAQLTRAIEALLPELKLLNYRLS